MGQSNPKLVAWAAQDGRVQDLVYHLGLTGPNGLKPCGGIEKRRTPLHLAAISGRLECISILYDAGADLNVRDEEGLTALHHSAANGHYYVAQLLLDLGANEKITTRFGVTPTHLATSCGHSPIMKVLASHGADMNAQESWGHTPLMIATQQSRLECIKLLFEMGVNKECCDRLNGNTALHLACITRDEQTLLLLLDGDCDVKAVNGAGLSPLGVAIENKFYRAISLLLEYGAIPNDKDIEISPGGLQEFIRKKLTTPLPLARLARVSVRLTLAPSRFEESLQELKLSDDLVQFINSIRDDCCSSNEAKDHALLGRTIITNSFAPATTKF